MADRRLGIIAWLLKLFDWWSARRSAKAKREMRDEIMDEARADEQKRIDAARRAGANAVDELRDSGVSEHTHFRD